MVRLLNSGTNDPRFESLYLFDDEHQVAVNNSYKNIGRDVLELMIFVSTVENKASFRQTKLLL